MRTPVLVTLFDSKYSVKAALMVASLRESGCSLPIRVLALDDTAERVFLEATARVDVGQVEFTHLRTFFLADPDAARAQDNRPWPMFCFTLASVWSWFVFLNAIGEGVVYLDADLWFLDDPTPEFQGRHSVALVPHRFGKGREWMERSSGKYNVSMVHFHSDPYGAERLSTWRTEVLTRCDAGTCGDQIYLDSWPEKLPDGILKEFPMRWCAAPWNVWDHDIALGITGRVKIDGENLGMYHMHEFERLDHGSFRRSKGYPLRDKYEGRMIYDRYEIAYLSAEVRGRMP